MKEVLYDFDVTEKINVPFMWNELGGPDCVISVEVRVKTALDYRCPDGSSFGRT